MSVCWEISSLPRKIALHFGFLALVFQSLSSEQRGQECHCPTYVLPRRNLPPHSWLRVTSDMDDPSNADVWLLNSCTVKNPAEDHFRNNIKKAQEQNKVVVVAGCVPQAQPRTDYLKGLSIIGKLPRWWSVQNSQQCPGSCRVPASDSQTRCNYSCVDMDFFTHHACHSVRLLGPKKDNGKRLGGARLDLPKIRKNPLIEIISINTGAWLFFRPVVSGQHAEQVDTMTNPLVMKERLISL
ncbi:Threonylcarbamoyladenosine tRNA methylthiotransferase [Bagarius yarrelli]|uniref:Threonylcarbamoyladenosine tRNA methylthiotransferase n=1 Tax=Bagarius yarrelli TaxID=175774 RepID=A0A556U1Q1_BAGYA|nr:Threonylcarbamoyladenosine tRNA methylthiotransferase [Bagarius yarrelli]